MKWVEKIKNNEPDFFNFGRPYKIELSREDGERRLSQIADEAEAEYAWAFDNETSTWIYYPSKKFTENADYEAGEISLRLEVPKKLLIPPSGDSDFYHIHPNYIEKRLLENPKEGFDSKDVLQVKALIPSTEDLQTAVDLTKDGYKRLKIVTSIGVTTFSFDPEKAKDLKDGNAPGVTISREDIKKWLEEDGLENAIKKALNQLNEHYDGVFVFSFEELYSD
ncbi:MAG: hypothetical protein R3346_04010 [Candidatus Spechtbacterales bacterium]|nr:hypothetical protein [Candidatus Spechtbacterales bacterium]